MGRDDDDGEEGRGGRAERGRKDIFGLGGWRVGGFEW